MKKKKLIILFTSIIMSFLLVTVFAAFIFHSNINSEANLGKIELVDKQFLDYSNPNLVNVIDAKSQNKIKCYATKRGGYTDEDASLIYLNQLGFSFSFNNTIDAYARIHFADAWVSKKIYQNGTTNEVYVKKDKLRGASPFNIKEIVDEKGNLVDFVYDEKGNYLYLKNIINGDGSLKSFSFRIDSSYFYEPIPSKSFREQVTVEVSYLVDIVQANRAEAIWNVDLDTIFRKGNA